MPRGLEATPLSEGEPAASETGSSLPVEEPSTPAAATTEAPARTRPVRTPRVPAPRRTPVNRTGTRVKRVRSVEAPPAGETQTTSEPAPPSAPTTLPATPPTACEPPAEPTSETPVCAQAETFGGAPADVLLTYSRAVSPSLASGCRAVSAAGAHEPFGGLEQGPVADTIRLQLAPGAPMPAGVECPREPAPASGAGATFTIVVSGGPSTEGGVVSDPIDPKYLLRVPFGKTSFWLQPWRAYLDTWPGSRLLNALGINFNTPTQDMEPVAQLLQESGFKLARFEIGFNTISYSEPDSLRSGNDEIIRARLRALHNHGLRPLIVLNANSEDPAPSKVARLETLATAPKGANTVHLSAASAAQVVPGLTGFNNLTWKGGPDVLITSVTSSGVATLSRRLSKPLPAGRHEGTTLLYGPFQSPTRLNGTPNPAFQATLAGWMNYVRVVCREAESITGPGGYDIEIWNELSFGSKFLNASNYGAPIGNGTTAARNKARVTKAVVKALLNETTNWVHAHDPGVGITDGFASETPFPSGLGAPIGLTALSKHPYASARTYPAAYKVGFDVPVNALGVQDLTPKPKPPYKPLFIPSYSMLMPEYMLTANSTETLIRDIAPITTEIYALVHGREVGPKGGAPVQKWITEYNISPPQGTTGLSFADVAHFRAKALTRSLVAMSGKGMSRDYFFGAAPGALSLIDSAFYKALEANPGSYPGAAAGGEILRAFHNLTTALQGPGPGGAPRSLSLLSIVQEGNHAQWAGDGTAAHPSLYDREVLAVLPFQTTPDEFVIPVYVMTSNLLTLYDPGAPATDEQRWDLPNESFRITLGGLPEGGPEPTVSAYDPLLDAATPARLVSRQGSTAVFEIAATDYPRLLKLTFGS